MTLFAQGGLDSLEIVLMAAIVIGRPFVVKPALNRAKKDNLDKG